MNEKLGIGVIGVGTFGSLHASTYRDINTCELRAVADVNQERLDAVCADFAVDGYSDYRDLLEREDIDAVSICTTDELHVEPAILAAEAGKHMFIEKPLATTPQDCDKIIESAARGGAKLTVGHILRFDPRYVVAYEEIASGGIGDIVHMYARRYNTRRSAGRLAVHTSVLCFLGVHDIDFLNWCAGAVPSKVYAEAVSRVLEDTPDSVLALLRYPGGEIASLEISWVLPESFEKLDARFEAVGTVGAIHVEGGRESVAVAKERVVYPDVLAAPRLLGQRVGSLRDELAHWINCVAGDTEPRVSPDEAKAAVVVACAIQESYETGSPVEID